MHYTIQFIVAFICTMFFGKVMAKKNHGLSTARRMAIFISLFTFGGIITHLMAYLCWGGIYEYMDYGKEQAVRDTIIVILSDIVFLAVIYVGAVFTTFRGKGYLLTIGQRKLLPTISLECFAIIIGAGYFILSIADAVMPQYGYWAEENYNINYVPTYAHAVTNANQVNLGYPLVGAYTDETWLEIKKRENETVILVVGDSFVWGDGASNINSLWWKVLQRNLIEKGYTRCRIVAVGKCGASTRDELNWLINTTMMEDINPDMVLFTYVTNDAEYVDNNGVRIPEQKIVSLTPILENILDGIRKIYPNVAYSVYNDLQEKIIHVSEFNDMTGYPYDEWEYQIIKPEKLAIYEDIAVKPLGRYLKELSIPYCMITTPNVPDFQSFSEKYEDVLPLFENVGIPVYDCLQDFCYLYGDEGIYFQGMNPVNSHPGIATNKFLGDYVLKILEENYKEVLGEKDTELSKKSNGMIVNDWFPFDLMDPISEENGAIRFSYSTMWNYTKYLYLPMKKSCVKICFKNPVDLEKLVIENSVGQICMDFDIWVTYLDENGFEQITKQPLKESNGTYQCPYQSVMSVYLHMPGNKTDGEYILRAY